MRGGGRGHLGLAPCAAVARAGAWVLAAACFAGAAGAEDPLAARRGWELGGQVARYRYEEPGTMSLEGARLGVAGSYTHLLAQGRFLRAEGRFSFGSLDYRGSGALNGVPDRIVEGRVVFGGQFGDARWRWSPYAGAGLRYLYNDLRGVTSTGHLGYQRESTYVYVPLGVTLRTPLPDGWVLAPQLEYDLLLRGEQRSYLSDTGLGYGDVSNRQSSGRGWRAQLMFENRRWSVGPWLHTWNIGDSDLQPVAPGVLVYEPANETREAGVELRYRF
jgi:hypothetical protein